MTQTKERELIFVRDGEEYIAVRLEELQELMSKLNEQPVWASGMNWLTDQTDGRSAEYLRTKILYPYKDELEEFVSYPKSSGEPWRFNIKPMKEWLANNKNFGRVNK